MSRPDRQRTLGLVQRAAGRPHRSQSSARDWFSGRRCRTACHPPRATDSGRPGPCPARSARSLDSRSAAQDSPRASSAPAPHPRYAPSSIPSTPGSFGVDDFHHQPARRLHNNLHARADHKADPLQPAAPQPQERDRQWSNQPREHTPYPRRQAVDLQAMRVHSGSSAKSCQVPSTYFLCLKIVTAFCTIFGHIRHVPASYNPHAREPGIYS